MTEIRLRSTPVKREGNCYMMGVHVPGMMALAKERWFEDQLWTWRFLSEGMGLPPQAIAAIVTDHAEIREIPNDEDRTETDLLITYDETVDYGREFYRYQGFVQTYLPKNWLTANPEEEDEEALLLGSDPESCPGCGRLPGEELGEDCNHPGGCGFHRAEALRYRVE